MTLYAWILFAWLLVGTTLGVFNLGKPRKPWQIAESTALGLAIIVFLSIFLFGG